jgi:hypothetical protein
VNQYFQVRPGAQGSADDLAEMPDDPGHQRIEDAGIDEILRSGAVAVIDQH